MAWFGETLDERHGAKEEAMSYAYPGSEWEGERQTTCKGGGAVESDKREKSAVAYPYGMASTNLRRTEQAPRIRYHRQAELEFRNVDSGTNRVPELNLHQF
jgi:hypothetical protein